MHRSKSGSTAVSTTNEEGLQGVSNDISKVFMVVNGKTKEDTSIGVYYCAYAQRVKITY